MPDMDNDLTSMDYKSKTQKKKEALELQKMGEKLVTLSDEQIKNIDLPAELSDAVKFIKTIKSHGARKRQMQRIGTLMRKIDPAPIQETLEEIDEGNYRKALEFKEIETWRDELIAGKKTLMDEILVKCPEADRQQLAQLVRNAVKEKAHKKPPRAFRALFRYLREVRYE
jgi:ribosome-associated protein